MGIFPTRILLATDGSKEAGRATETAVGLAQKTGSELRVVHVVPRPRPEGPAAKPEQQAHLRPREAAPRGLATATRLGRTAFEITSREGLRRHERSVVAAVAGAALAAGLAGARFPKALAWPLAALLSLLGATGPLRAAGGASPGVPRSA